MGGDGRSAAADAATVVATVATAAAATLLDRIVSVSGDGVGSAAAPAATTGGRAPTGGSVRTSNPAGPSDIVTSVRSAVPPAAAGGATGGSDGGAGPHHKATPAVAAAVTAVAAAAEDAVTIRTNDRGQAHAVTPAAKARGGTSTAAGAAVAATATAAAVAAAAADAVDGASVASARSVVVAAVAHGAVSPADAEGCGESASTPSLRQLPAAPSSAIDASMLPSGTRPSSPSSLGAAGPTTALESRKVEEGALYHRGGSVREVTTGRMSSRSGQTVRFFVGSMTRF